MKKTLNFFKDLCIDILYFFLEIGEEIGEMFMVLGYWFTLLIRAILTVGIPLAIIFGAFIGILWVIKLFL